jgi:beta-1,4-N-acetylglucosaminyltransferase
MLRRLPLDPTRYTFRTYIVTSGDSFSASKAVDFEATLQERYKDSQGKDTGGGNADLSPSYQPDNYSVISVPRARRVHQSFLTAPLSTLQCFWACLQILQGIHPAQRPIPRKTPSPYPDLILTNGPATAVCVVLAAKLLRFLNVVSVMFGVSIKGMSVQQTDTIVYPLRTVFIESWARVTTLSLSGKILLPFADRFLVQWPDLEGRRAWRGMRMSEYVGALVG